MSPDFANSPKQLSPSLDQSFDTSAEFSGTRSASPPPLQLQGDPATQAAQGAVAGGAAGSTQNAGPTANAAKAVAAGAVQSGTNGAVLEDRPQFAEPLMKLSTNPEEVLKGSSEIEKEISRLVRYVIGHDDKGNSPLLRTDGKKFPDDLDDEIEAVVKKFVPGGNKKQQDQMRQLIRQFLEGYKNTEYDDQSKIPMDVQRAQGGYDAMAALLAENTNKDGKKKGSWKLTDSEESMEMLHEMGYWKDLDRRVVNVANREYDEWTDTKDKDNRQVSESGSKMKTEKLANLKEYWKSGGYTDFKSRGEKSHDDHASFPWSAAFISHVMDEAGAADTFRYSGGHAYYGADARENETGKKDHTTHPSRLLDAAKTPVHVGGLIHRHRKGGSTGITYKNLKGGMRTHADLVVDIEIYDAKGQRVVGHYQDIIDKTDAATLKDYQIFAVTIGGNTNDQELGQKGDDKTIDKRSRSGAVKKKGNETVGKRYWKLNSDLTVDNTGKDMKHLKVYGIQKHVHP